MGFVHLHVHSPWSWLDGATEIDQLVLLAAEAGMPARALTDHDNVCAAVRFTQLCRQYGIRPILGTELTMEDGSHITLLARTRAGYANLCILLSQAHALGGRRTPGCSWDSLFAHADGVVCLSGCSRGRVAELIRKREHRDALALAQRCKGAFGAWYFLELQDDWTPGSLPLQRTLAQLSTHTGIPLVATNNVHYGVQADAVVHEALRAMSSGTPLGLQRGLTPINHERWLKPAGVMEQQFAAFPDACRNTLLIADACTDVLPIGEVLTPLWKDGDPQRQLHTLVRQGARVRYGITDKGELSPAVEKRLAHELDVICTLGFADYFLMVHRIVSWARARGIRCAGRGSAADSCVAYCLWFTDVDVIARGLPFARFLYEGKTPDIDVDFPSDRRDEVFTFIRDTYGDAHVARVCTFHTFLARSAIRGMGKALSLPEDAVGWLAKRLHHFLRAQKIDEAFSKYPELAAYGHLRERFALLFSLCSRVAGFPRHIGSHSSGVVVSRQPLMEIAPVIPAAGGVLPIWTLDKDDSETVGAIKFDVLALRMLSAVSDAERAIKVYEPRFRYDAIPMDDEPTYRVLQSGHAVGVFQFESAAQLSLAVSLRPRNFEDLVAAVALIRPGPVRGNVVQRFVGARNGWLRIDPLHPALEPILAKTYGCIVFQEQVDLVIAAMTGWTHMRAERFRKDLVKHTKLDTLDDAEQQFRNAVADVYPDFTAEAVTILWSQLAGWGGYGFIEGHAAAFALTGYRSAYLLAHNPAEFIAGLMNHQPMGYYNVNSLAAEARRRGVDVLNVDIHESCADTRVVGGAIQVGWNLLTGLGKEEGQRIDLARSHGGPFTSLLDFCIRVPLRRDVIENLILCGAFDTLDMRRRGLVLSLEETIALANQLRGQRHQANLYSGHAIETPVTHGMTEFDAWQRYEWTWRVTGISPDGHAMALLRDGLTRYGALTAADARNVRSGTRIRVAGLNIRPHRPPTRSGNPVLFTTVEDETGILQLICAGDALNTCTATLLVTPLIFVEGILRRKGAGASLQVEQVVPLSAATYRKRSMAPDYTAIRGKTPREVTVTHGIRQLVTAGDG